MNPKRFWGKDMSEALRAVRSALGPDALIIDTSSATRDGGYGVEITALTSAQSTDELQATEGDTTIKKPDPLEEVKRELAALKSILGWLAPGLSHKEEILKKSSGPRARAGDHRPFGQRHEGIQRRL
jgi:flagellar biosynthesis GTPase FlhF